MAFSDFAQIRKSRGNALEDMRKAAEKVTAPSGGAKDDDRFWQPEVDKAGNGQATIRFLPAAPDNEYPWARVFSHGFKNDASGKWFIEECPTTINGECPVCAANNELWNTGDKDNQAIVRNRKRKLNYIANVLIIKDSKHPENEGQVKLFKFGSKIFDKIKFAMEPQFEDETPMNPFDFWEGANFKLKICKVEGYRNYDRSEFDSPSAISEDDDEIEAIWKKEFSLKDFTDPSRFKSFDDLKKRLDMVLGNSKPIPSAQKQAEDELDGYVDDTPPPPPSRKPAASAEKKPVPERKPAPAKEQADAAATDDDEAAYFASLLND